MRRRQYLAGLGTTALAGTAGCLGGLGLAGNGGGGELAVVDTLDARGSSAGRQALPVPGTPTVIDLFATWCAPCRAQMQSLAQVHAAYGDRVAFVSVTNERFGGGLTADDVRAWWRRYDGNWTVGHDPESDLMRALNAGGLPFTAVVDAEGTVTTRHRGIIGTDALRADVESVL